MWNLKKQQMNKQNRNRLKNTKTLVVAGGEEGWGGRVK